MKLICFKTKNSLSCEKIISNLISDFPDLRINVIPNLEDLKTEVNQEGFLNNRIALFLADSKVQLQKLISLKTFFINIPIILILPDNKQMFKIGSKLSPRFMSDFSNASFEIKPILRKLIIKCELQQ